LMWQVFIVSEAGASVYSASKIARRISKLWCNRSWFVSIGRRLSILWQSW
jgi:transcriptional accessory protein Tex/SPT6